MLNDIRELYSETDTHLLRDERPSGFLELAYNNPLFGEYPFVMLHDLKRAEQSPEHHPEGNVWNHTLLVVDQAARVRDKSRNASVFMWAALLHDIGKPSTGKVRGNKITSYDHDKAGEKLSADFLSFFTQDTSSIKEVSGLVRYHMHILYVLKGLPFADIKGMKQNTDINEVALLGLCDRLGRTNSDRAKEEEHIRVFIKKCNQIF